MSEFAGFCVTFTVLINTVTLGILANQIKRLRKQRDTAPPG